MAVVAAFWFIPTCTEGELSLLLHVEQRWAARVKKSEINTFRFFKMRTTLTFTSLRFLKMKNDKKYEMPSYFFWNNAHLCSLANYSKLALCIY
jgi:hypothetical protein